jgi:hypothetical protein
MNSIAPRVLLLVACLFLISCGSRDCEPRDACATGEKHEEVVILGVGLGCECVGAPKAGPTTSAVGGAGNGNPCEDTSVTPIPGDTIAFSVRRNGSDRRVKIADMNCKTCYGSPTIGPEEKSINLCAIDGKASIRYQVAGSMDWTRTTLTSDDVNTLNQ